MRENYEIAPNMSAKAEWVHELLPTARLRMVPAWRKVENPSDCLGYGTQTQEVRRL